MSTPMSSLSLKGTGQRAINVPSKTGEQQALYSQLQNGAMPGIQSGLGQLSNLAGGGNQDYWDQIEAPAKRQFSEAIGGLGARFSGLGGTGGRRSSGFQQATGALASDFAERLQSQRLGLQQGAIEQLLGLGQNLLGQSMFNSAIVPKKKKWWEVAGEGAADVGGSFLKGIFGKWF